MENSAVIERHNGQKGTQRLKGVVQSLGHSSLPKEFMTIGEDFDTALGRCVIRDDLQRNAINAYKSQMDMFSMADEISHLTSWLNSSQAVDGLNREQTLEAHVGIVIPKDPKRYKQYMDMQKQKIKGGKDNEHKESSE